MDRMNSRVQQQVMGMMGRPLAENPARLVRVRPFCGDGRHVGHHRQFDSITAGNTDQGPVWMQQRPGESTMRRDCGRAKHFFCAAVRHKLLPENPFPDMKNCRVAPSNPEWQFFLNEADSLKILHECPTVQWKLIFVLAC
ncbi:MAG: hypothetical protein MK110_05870 [Fuerstiella sp.]|nr:hypothetical protein [Fuerstiella sp.]